MQIINISLPKRCLCQADFTDVLWCRCSGNHVSNNTYVGFDVVGQRSSHSACLFAHTVGGGLVRHPLHSLCRGPSKHRIKRPIFRNRHFFNGWLLQPCRNNRVAATTANRDQIYHICTSATTGPSTSSCLSKQPQRTSVPRSLFCSTGARAREIYAAGCHRRATISLLYVKMAASNSVNCW